MHVSVIFASIRLVREVMCFSDIYRSQIPIKYIRGNKAFPEPCSFISKIAIQNLKNWNQGIGQKLSRKFKIIAQHFLITEDSAGTK